MGYEFIDAIRFKLGASLKSPNNWLIIHSTGWRYESNLQEVTDWKLFHLM